MDIQTIQQKAAPIFDQYHISYAGLFGSISRHQETATSDIDIMVKIDKPMGMLSYMRLINALETALQKKVDIVTDKAINKHVKPYILKDIQTIYEK